MLSIFIFIFGSIFQLEISMWIYPLFLFASLGEPSGQLISLLANLFIYFLIGMGIGKILQKTGFFNWWNSKSRFIKILITSTLIIILIILLIIFETYA